MCTGLNLVVALSYSSRWKLLKQQEKMSADVCNGILETGSIMKMVLKVPHNLWNPDPELMIRTSVRSE